MLINRVNDEMQAVSETIIQKAISEAMVEAEQKMRERLGAFIISQLDKNFSVVRKGEELVITVKQAAA